MYTRKFTLASAKKFKPRGLDSATALSVTTLDKLIERYQAYNRSINMRPATLHYYAGALRQFTDYLPGSTPINQIDQAAIDDYRLHLLNPERALSTASINSYLTAVKSLLNWGRKRGYIKAQLEIEAMKTDERSVKKGITQEDFRKLLKATEGENTFLLQLRARAILLFMFGTGARASEVIKAKYSNVVRQAVDGETAYVLLLEGTATKNRKNRPVTLAPAVWQAIEEYREELARPGRTRMRRNGFNPTWLFTSDRKPDEPLTRDGLRGMLTRLGRRAGIKCSAHDFRRGFAQEWFKRGGWKAIDPLMKTGGWQSVQVLKSYYVDYDLETIVRATRQNGPLQN